MLVPCATAVLHYLNYFEVCDRYLDLNYTSPYLLKTHYYYCQPYLLYI